MRIALVQQHAGPDRAENLARALAAMDRAAEHGAGLVAFAELALERFFPRRPDDAEAAGRAEPIPGPLADAIAVRARDRSLVTVFNMYERGPDGRCFDSSPVFDADGALLGVTRMVHIADYEGFHEKAYYTPGDRGAAVYDTAVGRVGVAICYDRHYPEYMRALGVAGARLVVIPQAGLEGEWPEGMFEAEVRTAAFQNGYFAALCNRVGVEGEGMRFAGESFVADPWGRILARGASGADDLVLVDLDLAACAEAPARLFWRNRRPELYGAWLGCGPEDQEST